MKLTGRQIVEQGIITKSDEKSIQQIGVDLRVKSIYVIKGGGHVTESKGTIKSQLELAPQSSGSELGLNAVWLLGTGAYIVEFHQGCNLQDCGNNKAFRLIQRNSMQVNGSIITSSIFDNGFKTENIKTTLIVHTPILIEYNARLCQAVVDETYPVDEKDLYNGQFQGK